MQHTDQQQPAPAAGLTQDSLANTRRPSRLWRWVLMVIVVLVAVPLDQASKSWVRDHLVARSGHSIVVGRWGSLSASLIHVRNPGAAWGLFSRLDAAYRRPFLIGVTLLAMGFVLYLFARTEPGHQLVLLALTLVMGGAVGNLIDRIRFNFVVDFIDVRVGSFRWPTFNVADIAITLGVALMLLEMRPRRRPSAE